VFGYDRTLTLAFDGGWPGPLALAGGLALVAAAAVGVAIGSRAWLVVGAFIVAAALGLLVFDMEDQRLQWAGASGVFGYESPHGGPVLQPALDDLKADARKTREARDPGWELAGGEHGFSSRGLTAWRVFLWSTLALLWLTGYRLARLGLRPWPSAAVVAGGSVVFFLWLLLRGLDE